MRCPRSKSRVFNTPTTSDIRDYSALRRNKAGWKGEPGQLLLEVTNQLGKG